ncbi:hypothetical protein PMZ80_005089 [Knufia obscura]|uniref:Aminopeptidase n=1 Tax=Knufia obscura TaxID=1635080 RepID=A0ABR0RPL3_9EURO|nr:hypothetical protein PMZ80_005089 [Knufia obscura]
MTMHRRSTAVKPVSYNLSLSNILPAPSWTYDGHVEIEAQALNSLTQIVLDARGLEVSLSAVSQLENDDLSVLDASNTTVTYDEKQGKAYIHLPKEIKPGVFRISLLFHGSINDSMEGFYRARYDLDPSMLANGVFQDEKYSYALATQFEPCDARRAFPCFDEPDLKAKFTLSIEVAGDLTALSNMPVTDIIRIDAEGKSLKKVCFAETPVMSTYLLAWAIGDFEYIESFTSTGTQVRVYTTKGLSKFGQFALKDACQTLDYFADIFEVPYALPKCDHLVVSEFVSGAMENWGLITYKPTKILFDEKTSDNRLMSKVSYVVAHELAHQWFGNLVTMTNWGELWLNEGFATWAGYLAVDHLHPEWNIWDQFVAETVSDAMSLDSFEHATHPIRTTAEGPDSALHMFDSISYFKGSSIIRMLALHIGHENFLRGVAKYLNQHAYGNARTEDLWSALTSTSGFDVDQMMKSWTCTAGFPLMSFETTQSTCCVKQEPIFKVVARNGATPPYPLWQIPLQFGVSESNVRMSILSESETEIQYHGEALVPNEDRLAFCATWYSSDQLDRIGENWSQLTPSTKAGVLADIALLTTMNVVSVSQLLSFLRQLVHEENGYVWSCIKQCLAILSMVCNDDSAAKAGFKAYSRDLTAQARSKVQWGREQDIYVKAEFEKAMIALAVGFCGDETFVSEVEQRFSDWRHTSSTNSDAIPRTLRSTIFGISVEKGDEDVFRAIRDEYFSCTDIDGREICLTALCRTRDPSLAWELLQFAFESEDNVNLQDLHLLGSALGHNGTCRHVLWDYVKGNWSIVYRRVSKNGMNLMWFLEHSFESFDTFEMAREVELFFSKEDDGMFSAPVRVAVESIKRNAAFKEACQGQVASWFQENGYS